MEWSPDRDALRGRVAACGGTAAAITPGFLRSEMMLENFGVYEEGWRDALASAPPSFAVSESLRGPRRRGAGRGSRPCPLEPAIGLRDVVHF